MKGPTAPAVPWLLDDDPGEYITAACSHRRRRSIATARAAASARYSITSAPIDEISQDSDGCPSPAETAASTKDERVAGRGSGVVGLLLQLKRRQEQQL
jgi:CelD/BcsL family acetyltransferase involved in cellulose biosynthesis